jgi:hypothetical protein
VLGQVAEGQRVIWTAWPLVSRVTVLGLVPALATIVLAGAAQAAGGEANDERSPLDPAEQTGFEEDDWVDLIRCRLLEGEGNLEGGAILLDAIDLRSPASPKSTPSADELTTCQLVLRALSAHATNAPPVSLTGAPGGDQFDANGDMDSTVIGGVFVLLGVLAGGVGTFATTGRQLRHERNMRDRSHRVEMTEQTIVALTDLQRLVFEMESKTRPSELDGAKESVAIQARRLENVVAIHPDMGKSDIDSIAAQTAKIESLQSTTDSGSVQAIKGASRSITGVVHDRLRSRT